MKKIFYSLMAVAAVLFASSCEDRLDIPQKGVVSQEDFYITDADAQSALTSAYYTMAGYYSQNWPEIGWNDSPYLALWSYASDDMYAAGQNKTDNTSQQELNSFRFDNNNPMVSGAYKSYYQAIYPCNLVIDHFDGEKATSDTKKKCVAEARVLRAYSYLMLALGWGNPPLIDHCILASERPSNCESQEFLLNWVAEECDKALPDLDARTSLDDKNSTVKVTKAFAYGIKGKALLSMKKWTEAKAALANVVNDTLYQLLPSNRMEDLFHVEGDGNYETVFEFNLVYDASVSGYDARGCRNLPYLWNWRNDKMLGPDGPGTLYVNQGWGECVPSKKFIDLLIANDGINSARRKAWVKTYDEVLYEMPYSTDDSCSTKEMKEGDRNRGITASDGLYGMVGYFPWKRNIRETDLAPGWGMIKQNFPLMRVPEVYLMYAEACAMLGETTGKGLEVLNKIQTRAQSQTVIATLSMNAVKTEKYLECWLECTRFQDLIRWGDAATELADNGKYLPSYCDAMFTLGENKHRGYVDESDAAWCLNLYGSKVGFHTGKNELFPFPFAETQINPNITQNPGWE